MPVMARMNIHQGLLDTYTFGKEKRIEGLNVESLATFCLAGRAPNIFALTKLGAHVTLVGRAIVPRFRKTRRHHFLRHR